MENSGFPKYAFSDNAAVVLSDVKGPFVDGLDVPADITNDESGRATHLDDAPNIAFAACHIAHNNGHVAVFASKVHFEISFLADLTNVGASNMEQLPRP
jgi:hypothetical protein